MILLDELRKAYERAEKLSPEGQDRIAKKIVEIIEEIESSEEVKEKEEKE